MCELAIDYKKVILPCKIRWNSQFMCEKLVVSVTVKLISGDKKPTVHKIFPRIYNLHNYVDIRLGNRPRSTSFSWQLLFDQITKYYLGDGMEGTTFKIPYMLDPVYKGNLPNLKDKLVLIKDCIKGVD